MAFLPCLCFSG
ncbi:hypothetical protein M2G91_21870 [Vibrio vulnificus]|nr:hypothetical protein [Vibrio vulnificus]